MTIPLWIYVIAGLAVWAGGAFLTFPKVPPAPASGGRWEAYVAEVWWKQLTVFIAGLMFFLRAVYVWTGTESATGPTLWLITIGCLFLFDTRRSVSGTAESSKDNVYGIPVWVYIVSLTVAALLTFNDFGLHLIR